MTWCLGGLGDELVMTICLHLQMTAGRRRPGHRSGGLVLVGVIGRGILIDTDDGGGLNR